MIISISGKAGSGKDTVGKIIQYLTLDDEVFSKTNADVVADIEHNGYCASRSEWQIKKYSDKLKDIVCILIGCTREQLEDQEFKETPLGKEWDYRMVFDANWEKQWTPQRPSFGGDMPIKQRTPRQILQLLGTEGTRDVIHPDIWVNALYSEYVEDKGFSYKVELVEKTENGGNVKLLEDPQMFNNGFPNWIITDSRFPNDVRRTREMGGILIRVNRDECEGRENEHASETALDDFDEWDYVIKNNGTIEELIEQVRTTLEEEGIIKEK